MRLPGKGCPDNFMRFIFKTTVLMAVVFLCFIATSFSARAEEENPESVIEENASEDLNENTEEQDLFNEIDDDGVGLVEEYLFEEFSNNKLVDSPDEAVIDVEEFNEEDGLKQDLIIENGVSDNNLESEEDIFGLDNLEESLSYNEVEIDEHDDDVVSENKVTSFVMPDLSQYDSNPFDFLLDPQLLFTATNSIGFDGESFKKNIAFFFKNTNSRFDYSDVSDTLRICNNGETEVTITIIARLDYTGQLKFSKTKRFENDDDLLYIALVDSEGNEVPMDECGFAVIQTTLAPGEDGQDTFYDFGLVGACNTAADWKHADCGDFNLAVRWFVDGEAGTVEQISTLNSENELNDSLELEVELGDDELAEDEVIADDELVGEDELSQNDVVSANNVDDELLANNSQEDDDLDIDSLDILGADDSVSDNSISDNSVSDNSLSDNSVSDNSLSDNSISENEILDEDLLNSSDSDSAHDNSSNHDLTNPDGHSDSNQTSQSNVPNEGDSSHSESHDSDSNSSSSSESHDSGSSHSLDNSALE